MKADESLRALLCGWLVVTAVSAVPAHEAKERVPIDWRIAAPRRVVPRPEEPTSPIPDPPPELQQAPMQPAPGAAESMRRPPAPGGPEAHAAEPAEEMAREAARSWGPRESWRSAFAQGFQAALEDPRASAWDHEQGNRAGRHDPRVPGLGEHFAGEAANAPADADAQARIKAQFMDLAHEPGHDRAGGIPPREVLPQFAGPYAANPVLDDVFMAVRLDPAELSPEGRQQMGAWRDAVAILARNDRMVRAYEPHWKDPANAFSVWRDRQHPGSYWARCSTDERDRFRTAFVDRFAAAMASADARPVADAWKAGFRDGRRYGARVAGEWAYRKGYAEGFDASIAQAASVAFPYAYARAYDASYDRWFNAWSSSAHPGLIDLRVADDNDDGVFEPGERLRVEVSVVNYGGGDETLDLIASGRDLGPPSRVPVRLAGRGPVPGIQRLSLKIADGAAPRTVTNVTVAMGDARADAPLAISRPLQFERNPTIEVDRLEGRVTLSVAVTNTSRREVHAVVRVTPSARAEGDGRQDLGTVGARARATASIGFHDIHPLDLIGSATTWHATIVRDGITDDVSEIRLAPVATDLSNPDLLDFMLAMAKTPSVSRSDVEDARALMTERLRADWRRAVDASGNPYKRDFDGDGAETVLGQLVRVVRDNRRSLTSPQVFDGIGDTIAALSDDLPGPHPLLRKWMRKLAGRL